jgi:hypothetical protein
MDGTYLRFRCTESVVVVHDGPSQVSPQGQKKFPRGYTCCFIHSCKLSTRNTKFCLRVPHNTTSPEQIFLKVVEAAQLASGHLHNSSSH